MGKSCVICGKGIVGKSPNARMCSPECAKKRQAQRSAKHKEANPEAVRKNAREWATRNRKPRELPERSCAECGKTFLPARTDSTYCSGICRSRAWGRTAGGKTSKSKSMVKARKNVQVVCPVCGKQFTKRGNMKWCSPECRRADPEVALRKSGYNKKYNEKPGVAERVRAYQRTPERKAYEQSLKDRDYYVLKRLKLTAEECPPDLLEAKRAQLRLKRLIKEVVK